MATISSDLTNGARPNFGPNVRVIARIRGFTDTENHNGPSWISVHKPDGNDSSKTVKIAFKRDQLTSHKETCELDYCYEQNEDNCLIYSREIKHLVSGVFDGRNASVIAYGARGSGKTYTIQGFDGKPGLAVLAMEEILLMAEKAGFSVSVSCYEIYQEHIYDCLNQEHSEVSVMEDAQGRVNLKGLSQAYVKSMEEFRKVYFHGCVSLKTTQKILVELSRRSHKALMVHISSHDDKLKNRLVGKMNFVDMAGYEDGRKKGTNGSTLIENAKMNKPLYAIQNVVYAVNAKETHVPYRESKLTRLLQDSLGGENRILMVTCLNPSVCQDTVYMASLASRSCQSVRRIFMDSSKKTENTARRMAALSGKIPKSMSVSAGMRKPGSRLPLSEKKSNIIAVKALKGRKLFDEANQMTVSEKAITLQEGITSAMAPALSEEERISDFAKATSLKAIAMKENNFSTMALVLQEEECISDFSNATQPSTEKIPFLAAPKDIEYTSVAEEVISLGTEGFVEVTCDKNINTKLLALHGEEKEIQSSIGNGGSPPLSARLQELARYLKSVNSSTPIKMSESSTSSCTNMIEPITPISEQHLGVNHKLDDAKISTPWTTFNVHSAGMKNSLARECLKFINSANKEELKGLKGIGEKRATYIMELREESPEYFKNLDDLKDIGLSAKQIKGLMKNVAGDLFD